MRIDAHQHFWNYDPSMTWIDEQMLMLRKNYTPENLRPILKYHKMDGCIAVQVNQNPEENIYMLNLAREYSFIKGVVGWVDFCGKSVKEELERYSEQPLMKGFRHILQGEEDDRYMLQKNFLHGISQLQQFNFTYDLLIKQQHLPHALSLVKQFPEQKFVVDHIAKPDMRSGLQEQWKEGMQMLSECENVWCKFSGMVTEADCSDWKKSDITPYMDVVLESFGPSRILFGSDWPVCLLAASYKQTLLLVEEHIQKLSAAEQELIMGKTALKFYNIKQHEFTARD